MAINDARQIVGYSSHIDTSSGTSFTSAFLYSDGKMTALGTLPGDNTSGANAIDASGQIVGEAAYVAANLSPEQHGFLYSDGVMTDLGALPGGPPPGAVGINDAGQIAVNDSVGISDQAFIDSDGEMTSLGTLPGEPDTTARAINDAGEVVGLSSSYMGLAYAFLYRPGAGMIDLTASLPADSGWTLDQATAINDYDMIVGNGGIGGEEHAYLLELSPTVALTSPVWNTTEGGVDDFYRIVGGDLTEPTTVELAWAGGTTVNSIIGDPILSVTTGTGRGTYNLHATDAQLGNPPPGATDLLFFDPDNLTSPADPGKVLSLSLFQTISTIHSGDSPSAYGQSVTFEAQVINANTERTAKPTGTVQFYVDGAAYGAPVALDPDGKSFISDDSLSVGTHQITAGFLPDGDDFDASVSHTPASQVVRSMPTPTPVPTQPPLVIIGEQPVFLRKLNRKGKPSGRPILTGFTFDFNVPLILSDATRTTNYGVETITTRRVKKKVQQVIHPIASFSITPGSVDNAVTLTFAGKETFPSGGEIDFLPGEAGVTSAAGAPLSGSAVFIIFKEGRSTTPQ